MNALKNKAYPVSMLLVGMAFIALGISRYPAFLIVGALYIFIGSRGFFLSDLSGSNPEQSDKSQLESL